MKRYFGYVRVSTQRQGAHGVSLQEQKHAIETYATRNGLSIVAWFEERETAAKRGRRVFTRMLGELGKAKAQGVVIHKIDRSARNLRDWSDLGELIDRGIDVHFAHDALDLRSRGGRLSADIQAVVAADFIRNLREETRKGFYGRLKQGFYPMRAPIGYCDRGRGREKEIDPVQGPLVREAFELYATGEWNFLTLQVELHRRGLRGRRGTPLSLSGLTTILNNPFYMGLIHIRKTGETFEGNHRPLIKKALYDQVQSVLRGRKGGSVPLRNEFVFARLIRCARCGRALIGECQKGRYIYYRCHSASCGGTSLSEAMIDREIRHAIARIQFTPRDLGDLRDKVRELRGNQEDEFEERGRSVRLQLAQCEERIARLTDALIDGLIDKVTFDTRNAVLLSDKRGLQDRLAGLAAEPKLADVIEEYVELPSVAYVSYMSGIPSEKREAVISVLSNSSANGKELVTTPISPFKELQEFEKTVCGDPYRDGARTRAAIFEILKNVATEKSQTLIRTNDVPQVPDVPAYPEKDVG